jgi:hypothetical protein
MNRKSPCWSAAFLLISLTLAAPVSFTLAAPAACTNTAPGRCYSPCDETSIAWLSPFGDLILLATGIVYDVDPRNQEKVADEWWVEGGPNPDYDVLICDTGMLTNKDRPGGETVKVTPREEWKGDFDAHIKAYFEKKLKELKGGQR